MREQGENKMKRKSTAVWAAVLITLGLAGLAWFAVPLGWGVLNAGNAAGLLFSAAVLAVGALFPQLRRWFEAERLRKGKRAALRILQLALALGILWSAVLTGCMIQGAADSVPPGEPVTVVVLGSKVNGTEPSADLQARINAAYAFLVQNPPCKAIASGGKGAGEAISEAEAIRRGLVRLGIDENRVLLEDQSTSTLENIAFSQKIIREHKLPPKLAIVTDEYHQFRAGRVAEGYGSEAYAVPAHTPWYIFSACYARELLALTNFLIL